MSLIHYIKCDLCGGAIERFPTQDKGATGKGISLDVAGPTRRTVGFNEGDEQNAAAEWTIARRGSFDACQRHICEGCYSAIENTFDSED